MPLDFEEVALRARERITEVSETDAGFTPARLMTFINDAREGLAEMLAAENDGQYVYTKTFQVNALAGVADLSGLLAAAEPLILAPDALAQSKIYIEGYVYQLRIFPDLSGLQLDPAKVAACALENTSLYIKSAAGRLGSYASAVRINAPHVPALENIRKAHERKLIDVVVTIALATLKQPNKRSAPKPAAAAV